MDKHCHSGSTYPTSVIILNERCLPLLYSQESTNGGSTIHTEMNSAYETVKWSADNTLQMKESGRTKCRDFNDFQADTSVHQYESVQ